MVNEFLRNFLLVPSWLPFSANETWLIMTAFALLVSIFYCTVAPYKSRSPIVRHARKNGLQWLSVFYVIYLVYVLKFLNLFTEPAKDFDPQRVLAEFLIVTAMYIFVCAYRFKAMNRTIPVTLFSLVWIGLSVFIACAERDASIFAAGGSIPTVGGVLLGIPGRRPEKDKARVAAALALTVFGSLLWGYGDRLLKVFVRIPWS